MKFFILFLFFSTSLLKAEEVIQLPAVEVYSTPFSSESESSFVVEKKEERGSQSVSDDLKNSGLLQYRSYGGGSSSALQQFTMPGSFSAEDTGVYWRGVPLSTPQGGGVDFSFYPSYLWKSYALSDVASVDGGDALSTSGRIELQDGLHTRQYGRAGGTFQSTPHSQFFSSYSSKNLGATLGHGFGPKSHGTHGILSYATSPLRVGVFYGSQNSESDGSTSFPTPDATQDRTQVIPVLEFLSSITDRMKLESRLYSVYQNYEYENPDPSFGSRAKNIQKTAGVQETLRASDYTLYLQFQHTKLKTKSYSEKNENLIQSSFSKKFSWAQGHFFTPKVGVQKMTRFSGSLRVDLPYEVVSSLGRNDLQWLILPYYSEKTPSLDSRYYEDSYFLNNETLEKETQKSIKSNLKLSSQNFQIQWGAQLQRRDRIILLEEVSSGVTQNQNQGRSLVGATFFSGSIQALSFFRPETNFLFQVEKKGAGYASIPYFSPYTQNTRANFEFSSGLKDKTKFFVELNSKYKTFVSSSSPKLGSIHTWNAGVSQKVSSLFRIQVGVENLTDKIYETTRSYPTDGRVWTASLQGEF